MSHPRARNLVVVLGDQLDRNSPALADFDAERDVIFMAEVAEESTHVRSHKVRTASFLAAMRHFRDDCIRAGRRVHYTRLLDRGNTHTLGGELARAIDAHRPEAVVMVEAGDLRVETSLIDTCAAESIPLTILEDSHFLASKSDFVAYAAGKKQLRLEFFYRELRRRHKVLVDECGGPEGGQWNYDADNRGSFGKSGPGLMPAPIRFEPGAVTKEVFADVEIHFPDHPGDLSTFDWPVTPAQAQEALADFVAHRLPEFGTYQDAMWTGQPWLYHARLSSAMNLKLLDPRDVIAAAEKAYRSGDVDLACAEGFIRQILGWREYVRGIYFHHMPGYDRRNALGAKHPLPAFYWTGETEMNCLRECLSQTLRFGYAHHIQRLMVTGLYAMLFGVDPFAVHEWYLAVYIDAVEWVELPNTLGMSQFGDGGVMASKPYAATGKYIDRMSNYCRGCRYDPDVRTGETACPFTTMYWDFLMRHEDALAALPRMTMQVKNLGRIAGAEKKAIKAQARRHRLEVLGERWA